MMVVGGVACCMGVIVWYSVQVDARELGVWIELVLGVLGWVVGGV